MFFAATILNPRDFTKESIDLAQYFLSIRRFFFAVLILMLVLFTIDGPLFRTEPVFNSARITQAFVAMTVSGGLISDKRNVQTAVALATLAILCALTAFRFFPS